MKHYSASKEKVGQSLSQKSLFLETFTVLWLIRKHDLNKTCNIIAACKLIKMRGRGVK